LGFGFWVSGVGFRVSGFGFGVSGFGLRVSGARFRVPGWCLARAVAGGKARDVDSPGRRLLHPALQNISIAVVVCIVQHVRLRV